MMNQREKRFYKEFQKQFKNYKMTTEELNELHHSAKYDLGLDEIVEQQMKEFADIDQFETLLRDSDYRDEVIDTFDMSIDMTNALRKIEKKMFNVDQHVLDYFDRLVEALKIVKCNIYRKYCM